MKWCVRLFLIVKLYEMDIRGIIYIVFPKIFHFNPKTKQNPEKLRVSKKPQKNRVMLKMIVYKKNQSRRWLFKKKLRVFISNKQLTKFIIVLIFLEITSWRPRGGSPAGNSFKDKFALHVHLCAWHILKSSIKS